MRRAISLFAVGLALTTAMPAPASAQAPALDCKLPVFEVQETCGRNASDKKDYEAAIRHYRAAYPLTPQPHLKALVHYRLALIAQAQKKLTDARREVDSALRLQPDYIAAKSLAKRLDEEQRAAGAAAAPSAVATKPATPKPTIASPQAAQAAASAAPGSATKAASAPATAKAASSTVAAAVPAAAPVLAKLPEGATAAPAPTLAGAEAGKMMGLEREIGGHDKEIYTIGLSGNGRVLISGGEDNLIRVWSFPDGKLLAEHKQSWGSSGNQIFVSQDGGSFAYVSESAISVRETLSGKVISEITQKGSPDILGFQHYKFVSATFLPSGQVIGVGKDLHKLFVWDLLGKKLLKTLVWSPKGAFVGTEYRVHLQPDGKTLLSACKHCDGNAIKIWDITTGQMTADVNAPLDEARIAFSRDGRRAALPKEATITIVDLPSGRVVHKLSGHHVTTVGSVAFSADGKRLASNDGAGVVNFWSLESGRHLQKTFEPKRRYFGSWRKLVFAPDNSRLVVAGVTTASSGKGELNRIQVYDVSPARIAKLEADIARAEEEKKRQEQENREQAARLEEARKQEAERRAQERVRLTGLREEALSSLNCEEVGKLDAALGDARLPDCTMGRQLKASNARELYVAALKYEGDKDWARAKRLYKEIMERFPKDDLVIKAAEQLAAIGRTEAVQESNRAAEEAAKRAKATAEQQGEANRQAIERANQEAASRQSRARSDFCNGKSSCQASCTNLPYGSGRDHCWGQCSAKYSGC